VQKILRLDTRTSPNSDKVYLFSGILVCGCCGNRMTRKAVPYRGVKYFYYYCPTTKKRGCTGGVNLKESDLTECVLESVKTHISNIASLETLVSNLDSARIARELAENLSIQVSENERRLETIREFKTKLYENMINGNLSKDEYKSLKGKYANDADTLVAANTRLQKEIESVLDCKHERLTWMEHFKQLTALTEIDRKTVIHLIHSIKVVGKTELEITFNYQSEYENASALLRKEAA
jgi:hypothetical protein